MTSEPLTSQWIDARLPGVQRHLHSSDLEAKLVDPLCDSAWDRLVLSHSGSNVFHSVAWAEVPVKTYEYFRFDPAADKWVTARDNVSGFHTTVFSRLPLPLNRMIGALVYPHLD